ncbi:hypothetical protein SEA_ROONEY_34 [Streptomyces phage Rooney]|jgi:hypothetical protein|nr:hypothetical protein SEA_ROONEY_34 [Streptomyces phage Rooney]
MNAITTAAEFEAAAYSGYVSRGIGDTDGWYHPIDKTAFVDAMRLRLPVAPEDFTRYNDTEFRPTQEECDMYNSSFGGKPKSLRLAVRTDKGWRTVEVAGTKAAHEFLSVLATKVGWLEARLEDYAMISTYTWVPQIRMFFGSWVKGNIAITDKKKIRMGDRFGKFASLLEYSETHEL